MTATTKILVLCTILLLVLMLCLLGPISPSGSWTGDERFFAAKNHPSSHNFIEFHGGKATQYIENAPRVFHHSYERTENGDWKWNLNPILWSEDRLSYTIDTNRFFILHPGWFRMSCEANYTNQTFIFRRDFSLKAIRRVRAKFPTSTAFEVWIDEIAQHRKAQQPAEPSSR